MRFGVFLYESAKCYRIPCGAVVWSQRDKKYSMRWLSEHESIVGIGKFEYSFVNLTKKTIEQIIKDGHIVYEDYSKPGAYDEPNGGRCKRSINPYDDFLWEFISGRCIHNVKLVFMNDNNVLIANADELFTYVVADFLKPVRTC